MSAEEPEEKKHDPREDICGSRRTAQVGRMSAIDLRCMLERWAHNEGFHFSARTFGDVTMAAKWPGEFEEPDDR